MNKNELTIKIIVKIIEYLIILLFCNNSTLYLFFNINYVIRTYYLKFSSESILLLKDDNLKKRDWWLKFN